MVRRKMKPKRAMWEEDLLPFTRDLHLHGKVEIPHQVLQRVFDNLRQQPQLALQGVTRAQALGALQQSAHDLGWALSDDLVLSDPTWRAPQPEHPPLPLE